MIESGIVTTLTANWHNTRKARTFRRIQEEAMRLFLERGYDETTVQDVADAAGVSHMTVFRHFPTKEALALTDEYDPLLAEAIRNRPPTESPLDSVEHAFIETIGQLDSAALEMAVQRFKLASRTPALQAGIWMNWKESQRIVAEALAARGGMPDDPLALNVIAGIAISPAATAVLYVLDEGIESSLPEMIKSAYAAARAALPKIDSTP
jgi:AcrR family transcriptional regulator